MVGLACRRLQTVGVLGPPRLIAGSQIVVARFHPRGAVDQLPHDVRVAGVPMGLGDNVNEYLVQRDVATILRPVLHEAGGVQIVLLDRGVGESQVRR